MVQRKRKTMSAEEYLSQHRFNEMEIQRIKDALKEKRRLASDLQGIVYDSDKVQSSGKNSTEEKIHKYLISAEKYEKKIDEIIQQQKEIEDLIERVKDSRYKQILRYHYLSGLNLSMTACMMNYSEVHICRLHRQALDEVEAIMMGNVIVC